MSNTSVMTKKERANGELERHDAIQDILLDLRILNRFNNGATLISEMIQKKQAVLNDLWCAGDDKYRYDINGQKQ